MIQIPVFLDTDIGSDIDDTWALALLLKSPELKLEYALTTTDDVRYRAKIIAKMLEVGGSADTVIGIGDPAPDPRAERQNPYFYLHKQQAAWIEDYRLEAFPGTVCENGVETLVEKIMQSEKTPKLLCIGPLSNIRHALELEPRIAPKCDFVGMHGSVRVGYHGSPEPSCEYNVMRDAAAAQAVFSAPWKSALITPLDTCGFLSLDGPNYQRLLGSGDPLAKAVIENYRNWRNNNAAFWEIRSSVICDVVAVYLAFDESLVEIETLPIRVTDDGFTKIDPLHGTNIRVATRWKDRSAFEKLVVDRLTGER